MSNSLKKEREMGPVRSFLKSPFVKGLMIALALYFFILAIKLTGSGFKDMGNSFSEGLLETVKNPISGLLVGVLATSIIQSSSTTTSVTVGMVASGVLPIEFAIPIVIGSNLGTTITNTIVSLGHMARKIEFKRAFSTATVHDMFNLCAVAVLFTLEEIIRKLTGQGLIHRLAEGVSGGLKGVGGLSLLKPLDYIIGPLKDVIHEGTGSLGSGLYGSLDIGSEKIWMGSITIAAGLIIIILSLNILTKNLRTLSEGKMQSWLNKYLFRSDLAAFGIGTGLTALVQSSSVTTSLIVPLSGAGVINIKKAYPYTLGANMGTTITALIAALAATGAGHGAAVTVALSHLIFNLLGTLIFYPLRIVPITMAEKLADQAVKRRWIILLFIGLTFFVLPVTILFILR